MEMITFLYCEVIGNECDYKMGQVNNTPLALCNGPDLLATMATE
jgi:hypothetical protein